MDTELPTKKELEKIIQEFGEAFSELENEIKKSDE